MRHTTLEGIEEQPLSRILSRKGIADSYAEMPPRTFP